MPRLTGLFHGGIIALPDAATWIRALDLRPHPEGGWYRETYRATEGIAAAHLPPRFAGARAFSTAIYFLLEGGQFSAWHRIRQDELWHFHAGDPLLIHRLDEDGAAACAPEDSARTPVPDLTLAGN